MNFFNKLSVTETHYSPFGSIDVNDVQVGIFHEKFHKNAPYPRFNKPCVMIYDQEPLREFAVNDLRIMNGVHRNVAYVSDTVKRLRIFGNSEKSALKDELCRYWLMEDWYYFFHGFAALDWYRDYQYYPNIENQFSKVFISLNRLCTQDRSYRLNLVSHYIERGILDKGAVSLMLEDAGMGTWKDELIDPNTRLSYEAKQRIAGQLTKLPGSLVLDKFSPPGHSSADSGIDNWRLQRSALWHVVAETVFYDEKLHLTEKIFKPISVRRPFILVGGPGNLAYIKSYGFKTFDRWIDESYDNESNPDRRMAMVVDELEKLCKLSDTELVQMHKEMEEVLDYNFEHFYGDFRKVIVDEMCNNLERIFAVWNHQQIDPDRKHDVSQIDFEDIKRRLSR